MLFRQIPTIIFSIQDNLSWFDEKAFLTWQNNYLVSRLNIVALTDAAIHKSFGNKSFYQWNWWLRNFSFTL